MNPLIQPVIAALAESFLPEGTAANPGSTAAKVVGFLQCKLRDMPGYLSTPIIMMTLMFDLFGIVLAGRPFRSMTPAQRARQVRLWKNSPISVLRDFIRFYESLSLFAYYSLLDAGDLALARGTISGFMPE